MNHTVTEHKFASGGAGLVIHIPGSKVVGLQMRFNSGFQFGDFDKYEVPHVMEHILATVTAKRRKPNEFMIEASKNGAYVNASTSAEANAYIFECADFELERIVDLMEEQVTEPWFAQGSMEAEIGNVREELTRNTTQHGGVCAVNLASACYPWLWRDYEARIGQLKGIGLDDVREHYRRTHTAANARFFIAGDFPDGGEGIAKRFEQMLEKLERGRRLERDKRVGLAQTKPVVAQRDIAQLYYRVSWMAGELSDREQRAATLLRMVLVGGMGSRVLGEARRRGLAYGVGATGHAEPGNSSFGFAGYVTSENAAELFKLMTREYKAVRSGEMTAAELRAAKDLVVGSVRRQMQTVGDMLGWYVDPYDETGEIRDFERHLRDLDEVSIDEVQAVGEKFWDCNRVATSFVGPLDLPKSQEYMLMLA